MAESAAKARWAPFEFLAERADNLTQFMVKANETATMIAAEIKSSGEQTTKLSRRSLLLTWVIVFLTSVNAVSSCYSCYFQRRQERADINNRFDKVLAEYMEDVKRLKHEQAVNRETIERLQSRIRELKKRLRNAAHGAAPTTDK